MPTLENRPPILPTEEQLLLLQRIIAGDEVAFAKIVGAYWRNIYLLALTYTKNAQKSEEITQDVFLQLWEKREELKTVKKFGVWLHVMARNMVVSSTREKLRALAGGYKEFDQNDDDSIETLLVPDRQAELKESYQILLKGIELLPEKRKEVFKLSRLEGMSNIEIATLLDLHPVTVAQHLAKALVFLRAHLNTSTSDVILIIILLGGLQ